MRQESVRMRSSKGMYAVAKAVALSKGLEPSSGNSKLIGFALSREELERVYAREGYALRTTKGSSTDVINNHIYNWKLAGLVVQVADKIFFILDHEDLGDWRAFRYIRDYTEQHKDMELDYIGLDSYQSYDPMEREYRA